MANDLMDPKRHHVGLRDVVDAARLLIAHHVTAIGPGDADMDASYAAVPENLCARCDAFWSDHGHGRPISRSRSWVSGGKRYRPGAPCAGFIPRWARILGLDFSRDRSRMMAK